MSVATPSRPSTPPPHPPHSARLIHAATEARHLHDTDGDLWRARALALAEAAGLTYRARWTSPHDLIEPLGLETFAVPSRTDPVRDRLVMFDAADETLHCDCPAGTYGRPCAHAGAVVRWLIQRSYALSEAGRAAQRDYERLCERLDWSWRWA